MKIILVLKCQEISIRGLSSYDEICQGDKLLVNPSIAVKERGKADKVRLRIIAVMTRGIRLFDHLCPHPFHQL